ncbi:MAG: lipid II flippase MurJ [bacterium]
MQGTARKALFRQQDLARVSSILAVIAIAYLLLRFLIVVAIADRFGTGEFADILFVAQLIPVTLFMQNRRALFLSFVPVYMERVVHGDEDDLWRFASQFTNLVLLVTGAFTVLYYVSAPWLMRIVAVGFTAAQQEQTVHLTRLFSPVILLFMVYGIEESILYSHKHFTTSNLAGLCVGAGGLLGVVWLTERHGLSGYAYGSLAGYLLQALIPFSLFWKYRRHFSFSLDLRSPGLVQVYKLLGPIYVLSGALGLFHVINRALATTLGPGRVSAFQYCTTLTWLLPILMANAILAPLFPLIAERTVRRDLDGLKKILREGSQVLVFAVLPVVAATILLRVPIVRLLFQRGEFSPADTALTARTLLFYAPFILAMTLNLLSSQVMINLKLVGPAARLSGAGVLINLVLCLLFMRFFDVGGIALATTISFYAMTWISIVFIQREIGSAGFGRLVKPSLKVLLVCSLAAVPTGSLLKLLEASWDHTRLGIQALALALEGGTFLAGFVLLAWALRLEEIPLLLGMLRSRERVKKAEFSLSVPGGG